MQEELKSNYSLEMIGILFGLGLSSVFTMSIFIYSMQFVTAAQSGVLIYIAIPVSYALDFIFYDKVIGILEVTGALIIIVANVSFAVLKGMGTIK